MFAWMWLTPIIYPASLVQKFTGDGLAQWAYYLNPMAGVVVSFQRALYGSVYYPDTGKLLLPSDSIWFYVKALGIGIVVALGVLWLGRRQFRRLSADFAEDL